MYHDSHHDFVLTDMKFHRDVLVAKVENRLATVTCNCEELVYSACKDAWYLPGRVFSKVDRQKIKASGIDPFQFEASFMRGQDNGRFSL